MNTAELLWRTLFDAADGMKLAHSDSKRLSLFYQVTVSQLKMVRTVYAMTGLSGDGITLKNLAKQLGTTAAAASEMVDVLVRKKILERRQDPADRRQVQIRLIHELHEHFLQVEERFTLFTAAFLETLPPEKQTLFAECLEQFNIFISNAVPQEK